MNEGHAGRLHHCHRTVIITVIAVTMVESTIDQVINMIAVRYERMSATVVFALAHNRRAPIGVVSAHCDHVLVIVSFVRMVQMPVVQVIHMPIVQNANVPAMLAVNVRMRIVDSVHHRKPPFIGRMPQVRLTP